MAKIKTANILTDKQLFDSYLAYKKEIEWYEATDTLEYQNVCAYLKELELRCKEK